MKKRIDFILVVLLILLMSGVNNTSERLIKMHHKEFNVLVYGAIPDDGKDDTDEIQAAINAALASIDDWDQEVFPPTGHGAAVVLPDGRYLTTDSLVIAGKNGIEIRGEHLGAVIRSEASSGEAILKIRDTKEFKITNLILEGNATNYNGVGATNGHGIEVDHGTFGLFEDLQIYNNGGSGIYFYNGTWGHKIINSKISHNAGDGINSVTNTAQQNTGANGNGLSIINTEISANADDGIEYASATLTVLGSNIENNLGSGIQLGSWAGDANTAGIYIAGNHFENNDSCAIKMLTWSDRFVGSVIIEGNWILANQNAGDTCAIMQVSLSGAAANSLHHSKIGKNDYTMAGGLVNTFVYLEDSRDNTEVDYGDNSADMFVLDGYGTVNFKGQDDHLPQVVAITAGTGIAFANLRPVTLIYGSGSNPVDITANPQIVDGAFNGHTITLVGRYDGAPVTFDDGDGLQLEGAASFAPGSGDVFILKWISVLSLWVEVSRSDN